MFIRTLIRLALVAALTLLITNTVYPPPKQVQAQTNPKPTIAKASPVPTPTPVQADTQVIEPVEPTPAPSYSGTKYDWMRQAGIPESDFGYVDFVISHESGWRPSAVNPSSGACGLPQALPCSKLGSDWQNPIVALKWADSYAKARYGSWAGAASAWASKAWW